jgi:hypothetical protein
LTATSSSTCRIGAIIPVPTGPHPAPAVTPTGPVWTGTQPAPVVTPTVPPQPPPRPTNPSVAAPLLMNPMKGVQPSSQPVLLAQENRNENKQVHGKKHKHSKKRGRARRHQCEKK